MRALLVSDKCDNHDNVVFLSARGMRCTLAKVSVKGVLTRPGHWRGCGREYHSVTVQAWLTSSPRGCIHHVLAKRSPRLSMLLGTGIQVCFANSYTVCASGNSLVHTVMMACLAPLSVREPCAGMWTWRRGKRCVCLSKLGWRAAVASSMA